MSISPVSQSYGLVNDHFGRFGLDKMIVGLFHYSLAETYKDKCGESQGFMSSEQGTITTGGNDVDGRITQALGGFLGRFQPPPAVSPDISRYVNDFGTHLEANNCPEGSPTKNLINQIVQKYDRLNQGADSPVLVRVRNAIETGVVKVGDLPMISALADLLGREGQTSQLAYRLLDFLAGNNFIFPPTFVLLLREIAAGFDSEKWAALLKEVFRDAALDPHLSIGGGPWQERVVLNAVIAGEGRDPFLQSVLTLLARGDFLLLRKFLYLARVTGQAGELRNNLNIAIYSVAAYPPSEGRRFFLDQVMRILGKVSLHPRGGLSDMVNTLVSVLSFEEADGAVEKILGEYLEQVTNRGLDTVMRAQIATMIVFFAARLKVLYTQMLADGMDEHERRKALAGSVVAAGLRMARAMHLDPQLIVQIESALVMPNGRAKQRLAEIQERYIIEMMELDERARRGRGRGGGSSGGGTPGLPSAGGVAPPVTPEDIEGLSPEMRSYDYEYSAEMPSWDASSDTYYNVYANPAQMPVWRGQVNERGFARSFEMVWR